MTPHFGYHEIDGVFQVCFYYKGKFDYKLCSFRRPIFRAKDHLEATELCSQLNDLIPLIGMLHVQIDPAFMLPDH